MATGLHSITSTALRAAAAALLWLLALSASAQTVRYIHTDALGSVAVVTDQNRNVVERREYEPYGRQLTPAIKDGPGYTGHVQDAATGLTYMQQRYYDPGIGAMLSVDPVTAYDSGDWRQFNRYAYAFNNPYKFTDPDGRQSKAAGKQIGRMIRAAWDSKGDPEKFKARMEEYRAEDRMVLDTIVDLTAVGPVKDAVEVSIKVASGEDAVGQGTGSVTGEVADQVTQRVLDGKIGKDAAQAVGAVVGKVVGDTVESVVDHSRSGDSPAGSTGAPSESVKPPEPINLRDKQ